MVKLKKNIFKLFISLIISIFSYAAFADDITEVYRAAMDTPESIKAAGGFYPRGMDGSRPNQPPPDINLWNHVHGADTGMSRHNSGYVSTTTSRGLAIRWVNDHLNHNGYVYRIRATPNFIDVNASLRHYSPHSEELEVSALGVIHWNQVIGWERVRGGRVGSFVHNPDYRERLYTSFSSSGAQPQLAAFPNNHPAWAEQPWVNFANCELKSSCSPIKSTQKLGEEWFLKSYYDILNILVTIID
ncbi:MULTISPECIES: enterotoxin A family protein [unclassified Bartonella]|uniref:enterotoxin A family protein n=1 Tax=unclassified Bartonella TaxID=2645622 RepID=UPI0009C29B52|nr:MULTISPECIES: enterotoxin A family protein [unclassified Bartonella]AQX28468.1 Cholera toxin subunit A precursor [Bartonella sp. JB15]AQX29734.1 Cholera toxin subunit A precursor [Bartonella sp. JB63]